MKAEIKLLQSLQLEDRLINYWPDDVSNFSTWIRVYLGPQGEVGSEAFDIEVCTPEWLKSQCAIKGPIWGGHVLIVEAYDYEATKAILGRYVATSEGDNWPVIAAKNDCYRQAWQHMSP
ncbi:immunity 8 family protein [Burkholderia alba]|uniref:immunity 8 family protein n=1 Tax=Burkholderia alba TaxID=2683677 RepID=UPI002B0520CF|nr:immunity 8 family protein [Burkholderia alba]